MIPDDYEDPDYKPKGTDLSVPTIHGSRDWGRSRSSIKRERVNNETALAELIEELLPLSLERWQQLAVPALTIDKMLDAKKIKHAGARARQVRTVRSTLRDADWTLVRLRLDQFRAGFPLAAVDETESSEAQVWSEQLLVQGDSGLARFMEEYPDADRKRLRQAVRNVVGAPTTKRGKTRVQLDRAVAREVAAAQARLEAMNQSLAARQAADAPEDGELNDGFEDEGANDDDSSIEDTIPDDSDVDDSAPEN
jgi:ribosome-associated protein